MSLPTDAEYIEDHLKLAYEYYKGAQWTLSPISNQYTSFDTIGRLVWMYMALQQMQEDDRIPVLINFSKDLTRNQVLADFRIAETSKGEQYLEAISERGHTIVALFEPFILEYELTR